MTGRVNAPDAAGWLRLASHLSLYGLPAVEAVPAELVRGPDLVREAERVHPSFLLGTPAAVPRELEHSRFPGAFDDDRADEIGAARPCVDVQSLDGPLGVGVKDLVHEADHLDPGNGARVGDRGGVDTRRQGDDVGLEAVGGGRSREELSVYRHGRNIPRRDALSNTNVLSLQTKLTGESAQAFRG